MTYSTGIGFLGVAIAAVFWGSYGVPIKAESVVKANIDPLVFQMYCGFGIFLVGLVVMPFCKDFQFTWYGVASSAIWNPASWLTVFAVRSKIGLSIAQGVWGGLVVIGGFMWGKFLLPHITGEKATIHSIGGSIGALLMMVVGVIGLCYAGSPEKGEEEEKDALIQVEEQKEVTKHQGLGFAGGIIMAALAGILFSTQELPLSAAPQSVQDQALAFVPNFGIGSIMVPPLMLLLQSLVKRKVPVFHIRIGALPGILMGGLWQIGNIGTTLTVLSSLGMAVGFPLTQTALLVSGLWGLLYYKEITEKKKILLFFSSGVILLGGAAMLSVFG